VGLERRLNKTVENDNFALFGQMDIGYGWEMDILVAYSGWIRVKQSAFVPTKINAANLNRFVIDMFAEIVHPGTNNTARTARDTPGKILSLNKTRGSKSHKG
jgi:hypothetical protein